MANKINYGESLDIHEHLSNEIIEIYKQCINQGWTFWIVDSNRGYCHPARKEITIPTWAKRRGAKYYTWYICHEMAHAIDMCKHNHGHEFMEILKRICPVDCIHFELGYKPRNAASAGIGQVGFIDISAI